MTDRPPSSRHATPPLPTGGERPPSEAQHSFPAAGFLVFLILAGLFAIGAPSTAPAAQSVGGVRVVEESLEDGFRLSVVNSNLAAITLTLTVTGNNAKPDQRMPVVLACPGPGSFPFVTVRPARPDRSFSYRVRYDWQFGNSTAKHAASTVYELPFASGQRHRVVQGFHGAFTHTDNNEFAVDFGMPEGTPVHAARDGVVEVVMDRFTEGGLNPALRDAANFVLVRHTDGTYAEYVHLQPGSVRVRPGDRIRVRELLGYSGNTGYSQGPHLHFAVFRAIDGKKRETFRVRFRTIDGEVIEPEEGQFFTAP